MSALGYKAKQRPNQYLNYHFEFSPANIPANSTVIVPGNQPVDILGYQFKRCNGSNSSVIAFKFNDYQGTTRYCMGCGEDDFTQANFNRPFRMEGLTIHTFGNGNNAPNIGLGAINIQYEPLG